jgi:hypothetical protein
MSKSAPENSEQKEGRIGTGSRREFLRSMACAPLAAGLRSGLGWGGVASATPLTGRAGLLACQ